MKSAIFGVAGQDGRILSGQLQARGQNVLPFQRGQPGDPLGDSDWHDVLRREKPDRIYYLAAHHRSSEDTAEESANEWIQSFRVHLEGWVRVLDFVRKHLPRCRVLYASSAHVFGFPAQCPQNEQTPLAPFCAYGSSKLAGMEAGRFYRKEYLIHISHVILYPHESIHRGPTFLSKKLLLAAQQAAHNSGHRIEIGDPEAICDWGYAPEYTEAMQKVLDLDEPDDFIVATGQGSRVAEFAEAVFSSFGLNWKDHVVSRSDLLTKPSRKLIGDPAKLLQKTGYRPSLALPELATRLVHDLKVGS